MPTVLPGRQEPCRQRLAVRDPTPQAGTGHRRVPDCTDSGMTQAPMAALADTGQTCLWLTLSWLARNNSCPAALSGKTPGLLGKKPEERWPDHV
jgi:hypothetical protein